ncbi:ShlB/FhaC/HecB family hemolysin secretion/activation protein [Nostoc sp. 3335mG]|nr:ShlB/FhaC/HecB family hemolysin secretion/activation protein [Nostoc sp. 3335mG]
MRGRRTTWKWAAGGLALAAAWPATAQVAPQPGTGVAPPTREELNRVTTATQATPKSRLTISGDIEHGPCPLADPRYAAITVPLKDVQFDGLDGIDPATLRPAFAAHLGRTVPIATVCEIRDQAAALLRQQGWLAAVQVPPQRIADGVVHLQVVLAKLVAIHVRGDTGHAESLIAAYLDTLKDGQPFNQKNAERRLLLADDLPGYDIRLTLRPAGTAPGDVVGDVIVARIPFAVTVNVQNYGSHQVGRWSGLVTAEVNDILGLGDRAVVGFFNTTDIHEQSVAQGSYEIRPGNSGLTLSGRFTYAWTRPDIGQGNPIKARTLIGSFEASYPLIRSQADTLRLAGGLDIVDQRLRFAGLPFTEDKLRVLYGRLDYIATDSASLNATNGYTANEPRWRLIGSLEVRKGLGALGASDSCGPYPYLRCFSLPSLSRLDADPQGGLIRLGGTIEMRPDPKFTIAISPRAQYAFDPLLSYEQFSAGNYTVGRGYDPGALIGDSGYGVQGELRFGKITPSGPKKLAIQPFVFFDAAWTWTRGRLAVADDPQHLYSAGGGVRTAFGDKARLDLMLAAPLTRTPFQNQRGDVRFLVNFTTRFAP